ncbi:GNAT family N-acetyltransferase [Maritimibacter sp. UBA3975]|uniref:GNAT family N-acetyltransferase n=1 Tax=Maritimibacter sp. UBA3975 TaxID=1946833 RepID=UPI000C08E2C8|nr:GNAT family N-acetyltransferase [Maritimibacter sp. UBA3975]MAM61875.1 GNAT family N-acetyltransferase [Maritimibacter sp.]|tara:strand:+ start:8785 stop:9255 length:471 start_codon:yes stop_codon:yes gene_type:complete
MPLSFLRLTEVDPDRITAHMRDPRLRAHMPLLPATWDDAATHAFIEAKEATWQRDGLGHWAFVHDGDYLGWGGFQKEGDEWDFGLVLSPDHFGAGQRIARACLARAVQDLRIPYVTFLLPPSRTRLAALHRLGAEELSPVTYAGETFRKFRLDTTG